MFFFPVFIQQVGPKMQEGNQKTYLILVKGLKIQVPVYAEKLTE